MNFLRYRPKGHDASSVRLVGPEEKKTRRASRAALTYAGEKPSPEPPAKFSPPQAPSSLPTPTLLDIAGAGAQCSWLLPRPSCSSSCRARNWRGKPLASLATIVSLIASTKSGAGLRVRCELDKKSYTKGVKVTDEQMARIKIKRNTFHGDWNYTIRP